MKRFAVIVSVVVLLSSCGRIKEWKAKDIMAISVGTHKGIMYNIREVEKIRNEKDYGYAIEDFINLPKTFYRGETLWVADEYDGNVVKGFHIEGESTFLKVNTEGRIRDVSVDSKGRIFVSVFDITGEGTKSKVLCFDEKGNLMYSIGREGVDSEPINGFIYSISHDSYDNLYVVVKKDDKWEVMRFSPYGELNTEFSTEFFSFHEKLKNGKTLMGRVDFIMPMKKEDSVALMVSYYLTNTAKIVHQRVRTTVEKVPEMIFQKKKIHFFDVIGNQLENTYLKIANDETLMGITSDDKFIITKFSSGDEGGGVIVKVVDKKGKVLDKGFVKLEHPEKWRGWNTSWEGKLYGLFVWQKKVHLVFWESPVEKES